VEKRSNNNKYNLSELEQLKQDLLEKLNDKDLSLIDIKVKIKDRYHYFSITEA